MSEIPSTVTREQIQHACTILGLDPNLCREVIVTPDGVEVTLMRRGDKGSLQIFGRDEVATIRAMIPVERESWLNSIVENRLATEVLGG